MKRLCLFAGYDSKNIIHDYVVYYLKELSTVADVYYMADNEISDEEKAKIAPYVKDAYGKHIGAYDIGSWNYIIEQIGYEKIEEYDELILANDSVFGPLYSMKVLFEKLENDRQWDICGVDRAYNQDIQKYFLSNYFLVFRNNTFKKDIFKKHLGNLVYNGDRIKIINTYEAPFMDKFIKEGYCVKCVMQKDVDIYLDYINAVRNGSPFIKVKAYYWRKIRVRDVAYVIFKTKYPVKLISKHIGKKFYRDIYENIKNNILQINIKKDKIIVRIFGIYIIRKESKKQKEEEKNINDYDIEKCPIKLIES